MSNIHPKVLALRESTQRVLVELDDALDAAILALVARRHLFLLGVPGVAKSLLVDQLMLRIGDVRYFSEQFHRTMTFDTVFGPLSVPEFKKGNYVRVIEGYAPGSDVCFWDEGFRASASTLSATLRFLNERKFRNGGQLHTVPTTTVFLASNALPEEDREELGAMFDRLTLRLVISEVEEAAAFRRMLTLDIPDSPPIEMTWAEMKQAQAEAAAVPVSDAAIDCILDVRRRARDAGLVVSPRKWREAASMFPAAAWIAGDAEAGPEHGDFLAHLLWDRPEQIRQVQDIVLAVVAPDRVEANRLRDDVLTLAEEVERALTDDNVAVLNECFAKVKRARQEVEGNRAGSRGKTERTYATLADSLDNLQRRVMSEGFGIDSADLSADLVPA